MAGLSFPLKPKAVPKVETKYRRIATAIPAPESIPILKDLRKYEPLSMTGQPLVVWDRGGGCDDDLGRGTWHGREPRRGKSG